MLPNLPMVIIIIIIIIQIPETYSYIFNVVSIIAIVQNLSTAISVCFMLSIHTFF